MEIARSKSLDWSSNSRDIRGSSSNIQRDRLIRSDQIINRPLSSQYTSVNSIHYRPTSRSNSVSSQYVTNTFTATCVIVMIVSLSILVLLAFFAGSQDTYDHSRKPTNTPTMMPKLENKKVPKPNIAIETKCDVELVESLPRMLIYPSNSTLSKATFDAWLEILSDPVDNSSSNVHIASAYWTLRPVDMVPPTWLPAAAEGKIIFERLIQIAKSKDSFLTIVDSASFTSSESRGNDTQYLEQNGAKVSSENFYLTLNGPQYDSVLHYFGSIFTKRAL